jgi:hypothetical protein
MRPVSSQRFRVLDVLQSRHQARVDGLGQHDETVTARLETPLQRRHFTGLRQRPASCVFEPRRERAAKTVEVELIIAGARNLDLDRRAGPRRERRANPAFGNENARVDERGGSRDETEMTRRFRYADVDPVCSRAEISLQQRIVAGTIVAGVAEFRQERSRNADIRHQASQGFDARQSTFGNRQQKASARVLFEIEKNRRSRDERLPFRPRRDRGHWERRFGFHEGQNNRARFFRWRNGDGYIADVLVDHFARQRNVDCLACRIRRDDGSADGRADGNDERAIGGRGARGQNHGRGFWRQRL